ncbi:MAG: N-acetyl-gamma-glutamyl-phosphate reductase, partial [Myxococcota bacterium]
AAHVPALTGFVDRALDPVDPAALAKLDLVFLATPHGAAKGLAAALVDAPLVVDASSDHRPPHGGGASGWVYGPPELVRERYVGAKRIAAPGCFATAIELAVGPFVKAGAVAGTVCVAAATGSTGSGATPVAAAHHPVRFANLRAYSVGQHRHGPEVLAFLATLAASGEAPALQFVPISAPLDRGIFATCFVPVAPGVDPVAIVADAYAGCPLIRLREGSPEVRHVRGTALADLAVHPRDGLATVLVAIDNIGRGAAAQAVQCANLALGLPEATGLFIPACTP